MCWILVELSCCVGCSKLKYYSAHCGPSVWINSRYAFLCFCKRRDIDTLVKVVQKKQENEKYKATVYSAKIYPLLCDEPVAFIDRLCAFNLSRKGLCLEDAFIEVISREMEFLFKWPRCNGLWRRPRLVIL